MKSITFRCTTQQHQRIAAARKLQDCSQTELITTALKAFLSYAEQPDIRRKNLFALVEDIDGRGNGPAFADQA